MLHPEEEQLDPLEQADVEEEKDEGEETVEEEGEPTEAPPKADEEAVLAEAVEKVAAPVKEEAAKPKSYMVNTDLISRPLTMDDLFDEGTI